MLVEGVPSVCVFHYCTSFALVRSAVANDATVLYVLRLFKFIVVTLLFDGSEANYVRFFHSPVTRFVIPLFSFKILSKMNLKFCVVAETPGRPSTQLGWHRRSALPPCG